MPLTDHHDALTFLSASSNGFGSSGASLGRAVHACPALRKLALEDNKIDDEGGVAFSLALTLSLALALSLALELTYRLVLLFYPLTMGAVGSRRCWPLQSST